MKTRRIAAMAALAAAVLLSACVEERYYGEVGWGGPVTYGPRYADPYYGGYNPRYERYDRYSYRRYDRRYDRRSDRVGRPDYVARPGRPRPPRPGYSRPSRPDPIVAQPQPQPPRVRPNLPRGRDDCSGPGCSATYRGGRGEGWGRMN